MEHFVLAENRIYNLNHHRDFSSKVILLKKTLDKKIPIKNTCKKIYVLYKNVGNVWYSFEFKVPKK